jgi:DNA polymerase I
MAKWLLVDGFNLAYRCFFAIPELTRADGFPTNALHGWVKSIWRLEDQEKPDHCVVFFDLGGAQDRLALHPQYKAQREEMPEALEKQIPVIKDLTRAMGLGGIEVHGVESDDLLASFAVAKAAAGDQVLIVSSDKDFAQIVGGRIEMLLPPPTGNAAMGWRRMDAAGVAEKFGVGPTLIADYLALIGDTSDNIPGITGVGPKTASKWLTEHGSLEGVIAAAGELKPERFRQVVAESAARLGINKRLTTLNLGLAMPEGWSLAVNAQALFGLLDSMEMRSAAADARKRYTQPELF